MTEQQFAENIMQNEQLVGMIADKIADKLRGKIEVSKYGVWDEVKEHARKHLEKKFSFDAYKVNSFLISISGFLKPLLGFSNVRNMTREQAEQAKGILDKVFECVEEVRG